jgi:hypothetical protein
MEEDLSAYISLSLFVLRVQMVTEANDSLARVGVCTRS